MTRCEMLPEYLDGMTTIRLAPTEPGNMRDLVYGGDGISVVLSFNASPFDVWLPWRAVFAFAVPPFTVAFNMAQDTPEEPERPKLSVVQ